MSLNFLKHQNQPIRNIHRNQPNERHHHLTALRLTRKQLAEYPHSCVLAIATLALCVSKQFIIEHAASQPGQLAYSTGKTWQELFSHKHTEGPFCWVLTNIRKLEQPIPASGNMGLWPFNGKNT